MNMKHQDLIGTAQYCIDINLASVHMPEKQDDTPLFDQLQYLFQEIFLVSHFDPSHLLISPEDHQTLYHVARSTLSIHEVYYRFAIDMFKPSPFGNITSIRNLTTGKVVRLASLPDLDNGNVRVGFFPINVEFSRAMPAEYDPIALLADERLRAFNMKMSQESK
jgi:hypothetical protein